MNHIKLKTPTGVNNQFGTTTIPVSEILMFQDTPFESAVNIFIGSVHLHVSQSPEMGELAKYLIKECGFVKAYTRYNPDPELHNKDLGIKTEWEDGKQFVLFYNPAKVAVVRLDDATYIAPVKGDYFRIDEHETTKTASA